MFVTCAPVNVNRPGNAIALGKTIEPLSLLKVISLAATNAFSCKVILPLVVLTNIKPATSTCASTVSNVPLLSRTSPLVVLLTLISCATTSRSAVTPPPRMPLVAFRVTTPFMALASLPVRSKISVALVTVIASPVAVDSKPVKTTALPVILM